MARLFPGFVTVDPRYGPMLGRSSHQWGPHGDVVESIMGDFISTLLPGFDHYGHRMSLYDPSRQRPWVHFIKVNGFQPEEIQLKMDGHKLCLHAKHEQRKGEDVDIHEIRRSILVPSDTDTTKIKCHMVDDDTLMLQAPRLATKVPSEKKTEATVHETKTAPDVTTDPEVAGEQRDALVTPTDDKTSTHGETIEKTQEKDESETKQVPVENKGSQFCFFVVPDTPKIPESEISIQGVMNGVFNRLQSQEHGQEISFIRSGKEESNEGGSQEQDGAHNIPVSHVNDVSEIVESDEGKKELQLKMNLKNFKPENVSVRCQGNSIQVDAKEEREEDGMVTSHEVHKRYVLPVGRNSTSVRAVVDKEGNMVVSLPAVEGENKEIIPVEEEG